jgi:protein gp37
VAESKIEWTDYTFNPWEGCEKVSPGCKNCYAERRDRRLHGDEHWGPGSSRLGHTDAYWRQPLRWNREAAAAGRIARVFCGSLCDILDDHGPAHSGDLYLPELRERVFSMVPQTPNLMWLFLTKRPQNWHMFPWPWREAWPQNAMFGWTAENDEWRLKRYSAWRDFYNQTIGPRTFVSVEPMLGKLNDGWLHDRIDWVICGGESGHGARPMHPDWARKLRDDCAAAGVAFFFKQWGEWGHHVDLSEMTEGMQRVGKHAAGRLLDGVEHNALPAYWPANVGLLTKAEKELVVIP